MLFTNTLSCQNASPSVIFEGPAHSHLRCHVLVYFINATCCTGISSLSSLVNVSSSRLSMLAILTLGSSEKGSHIIYGAASSSLLRLRDCKIEPLVGTPFRIWVRAPRCSLRSRMLNSAGKQLPRNCMWRKLLRIQMQLTADYGSLGLGLRCERCVSTAFAEHCV